MNNKYKYFFILLFLQMSYGVFASPLCDEWLAKIISVQGKVDIQSSGKSIWQAVDQSNTFCSGDKIRISKHSRATIQMNNQSRITLNQGSTMVFMASERKSSPWYLNLLQGAAFFRSRQPQHLNIETPFINAVHEGTEFLVTVNSQQTEISVFDGQVAATNKWGEIHIKKGSIGIANKSEPPQIKTLTIRPEDAVQWTLYYPPIIDLQNNELARLTNDPKGNIHKSLALLEKNQGLQKNANYLSYLASLLLSVGSVDESLDFIGKVQSLEPSNSDVIALQAIIAVTKNQQESALTLAQKAVALDAQSATAQIALSYAYQSLFKIDVALKATQKAVHLSPENALAWARLSELQLSIGERASALESAKKAQQLNPKLDRTHSILGFAYLAQVDINRAKSTFIKGINLNSADPLARLGLGLAKIRKGDIEEGIHDLETAVSLDPENAVIRSYLGKAYYELKNEEYTATELAIAKEMDPKDPTAWFYDSIFKQTANRPVEALYDMEKAIKLNDNRAVYRSSLLLDEDLAAKTANLARIYNNLGFQRLGLLEARKSLNSDPTNYSAHRFFANSASRSSRNNITRVSELLQSQLLQPINTAPIQPQMKETTFSVIKNAGSSSFSLNEYNPLFSYNNINFLASGLYGSNNTIGDEVIISGIYDQFSASLGQYHFQTDGFRENDDLLKNIYTAFFQTAISPELNAQVEFYKENTKAGDIALRFNNETFHLKKYREKIDLETIRLGLNYALSPNQNILFSAVYGERDRDRTDSIWDRYSNENAYSIEAQYLLNKEKLKPIFGVSYFSTNLDVINDDKLSNIIDEQNINLSHLVVYSYFPYKFDFNLTATLGFSYDFFKDNNVKINQINPKLGLVWEPSSDVIFRASAFRTLKRQLITNQSIEPTQVSGFNQFYDNNRGASAWQYGIGLDYKLSKSLSSGFELIRRDVDQPVLNSPSFDQKENAHLAYIYWAPFKNISLSAEYHFDEVKRIRDRRSFTLAKQVITHSVPLSLNYHHSNGLSSQLSATYINQDVTIRSGRDKSKDRKKTNFWTFDASIAYRLPKRIGQISLEATNLFNRKFRYHNMFDANGIGLSRYTPERQLFVTLRLSF
ncbi:MAG: FecR domain-containing protein [Methylococcales bacterium]|nr:FecR domain-containing protein [Methylococcales bacterium]